MRYKVNTFNCLLIIALLIFSSVGHAGTGVAIDPDKAQAYTPAPENLKARERFQDNKFGIFLHWGCIASLVV